MIATQRTYENRMARIRQRVTPRIVPAHVEDVRRDVLWLTRELEETRAALMARTAQDDAQAVGV